MPAALPLHFLSFDVSEDADGVLTLEALASTRAEQHAAVMAEVQQVLDWAWGAFAQGHGPVAEGHDWDHDLLVALEDGAWHSVTLTLACSPRFAEACLAVFGEPDEA